MRKIIAVDIGTSRIKAACFDESGNMTHLTSQRLNRADSPDTQDAGQWFRITAGLLREITADRSVKPECVVLTGNMHALLGIGSDGIPVAPARLWSCNAAQAESDEINTRYEDRVLTQYGNRCIPVFTLPKILRMKRQTPDLYEKSVCFLQSKDYIAFRLTGELGTDPSDASGVLGMDLQRKRWDYGFIRELGLDPGKLPEIIPSAAFCGTVTSTAASLTGLQAGTPVAMGTGDLASAALGSGVNDSSISLTLGTAGQLLAVGKPGCGKKLAGKLFVFAHADPEQELYLGSVPSGGFSFEWLAKMHNLSMEEFFRLAESVPLSDDLPVFLPYILGRGAPSMDYTPCGGWIGLRASHSLAQLCRAAVFGTLCPLRQCADLLETLSGPRENIMFQALACREKAVRETAGALFHRQNACQPENPEASLLGAAIIGFTAIRRYRDVPSAAAAMIRNKPLETADDPAAERLYQKFLKSIRNIFNPQEM